MSTGTHLDDRLSACLDEDGQQVARSTGRIPAGGFEAAAVQRGEQAVTVAGTPLAVRGLDVEEELLREPGRLCGSEPSGRAGCPPNGFGLG